jgi:glycosyltransferase involved in cell wall biosynthesis
MKLLVVTGIFPPDIGGPATYVPKISEEIVKRGHSIIAITLSDVPIYTDAYNFDLIRIPRNSFKPIRLLKTILCIIHYGRQADLLFVNGLALETTIANYLLKKPVVQKVVGDFAWERARNKGWTASNIDEFQKKRYPLKIELLKRLRSFCINKSDLVIVPSLYMSTIIKGWGIGEKKIAVIYNSSDKPLYNDSVEFPEFEGFTIIAIGRLISLKKVDNLIRVVAELSNCRLIIVGSGPEEQNLKNIARELGINNRVIFTGQVTRENALSYLKLADLFVQNSIHEGFPHVVLEAMQIGVPVIATKVGGTTEIVEDNVTGILVEQNNNEQLKRAIEVLIKDKELKKKLVINAKEQLEKFSAKQMVESTLKVFSEIASESYSSTPSVLFVGGTRYSYPLNETHKKKFSSLSSISKNYIFAYSIDNRFRTFFDSANFYLIPSKLPGIVRYPFFLIMSFWMVLYIVYKKRVRVVICQSPYEGTAVILAKLFLKILGKQISVVTELHSDWELVHFLQRRPSGLLFRLYFIAGKIISTFVLKNSDLVRTISEFTTQKVSNRVSKPVIQFPAYIDIELFLSKSSSDEKILRSQYNDGFIFCVGALIYGKGIHVLIESMKLVVKRHKNQKLLIAGEGDYKDELERLLKRYELEDNVTFLGHLDQRALKGYMDRCLTLILPSLSEGLGRVIVEAFACGKPVIGTNVGGIPDLIKDSENGFLVPPNDVEAIREKINYLIDNPRIAREMGERGRRFVQERFSTEIYALNFRKMVQTAIRNIS